MNARRRLAVVALGLGGLVTQLGVASAAQLNLTGPVAPSAQLAQRCADEVTSTTVTARTSTSVRVADIPAECARLPVTARVYRGAATAASNPVAVPSGGGAVDLTVPAFSPTTTHQAYVTIGGWPVPATWDFDPWSCVVVNAQNNPVAGRSCTVTGISASTGVHGGVTSIWRDPFATFTITTSHDATSSQYVRVVADLATATGLPAGWFSSAPRPATSSSSTITVDGDMACNELSWYRGRGAGSRSTFSQQVRNDRNSPAWWLSGGVTCDV